MVRLVVEALRHCGGHPRGLEQQELDDAEVGHVLLRLVVLDAERIGARVRVVHAEAGVLGLAAERVVAVVRRDGRSRCGCGAEQRGDQTITVTASVRCTEPSPSVRRYSQDAEPMFNNPRFGVIPGTRRLPSVWTNGEGREWEPSREGIQRRFPRSSPGCCPGATSSSARPFWRSAAWCCRRCRPPTASSRRVAAGRGRASTSPTRRCRRSRTR